MPESPISGNANLGKLFLSAPLGTQFARIVLMAGIDPIEKPFSNMRASRSTEVYAEHGAFLESKWIGHSQKIARDHYFQVREEDFDKATKPEPEENDE